MKLNHRLLITSGLLLAMSTVAMSTATYAWFTTSRKTTVTMDNISIQKDSDLDMRIVSVNADSNSLKTYQPEKPGATYDVTTFAGYAAVLKKKGDFKAPVKSVQDISGNGWEFFKPAIASDAKTIAGTSKITDNSSSNAPFFNYVNEIVIEFQSDRAYEVWAGSGTNISDATNGVHQGLENAARIAFFEQGASESTPTDGKSLRKVYVAQAESGDSVASEGLGNYHYLDGTDATATYIFADDKTIGDSAPDGYNTNKTNSTYASGYNGYATDARIKTEAAKEVFSGNVTNKVSATTGNSFLIATLATKLAEPAYATAKGDKNNESEGGAQKGNYYYQKDPAIFGYDTSKNFTQTEPTVDNDNQGFPVLKTYNDANGNLVPAYTSYVTIRIWVEGTDTNCINAVKEGSFSTKLDFTSYIANVA